MMITIRFTNMVASTLLKQLVYLLLDLDNFVEGDMDLRDFSIIQAQETTMIIW